MFSLPSPRATDPKGSAKEIRLTDTHFEDSETVRLFLEVMSTTPNFNIFKALPPSYQRIPEQVTKLAYFMDKYSSENGIEILRLCSSTAVLRKQASAAHALVLACASNDLALCFCVATTYSDWTWPEPDPSRVLKAQPCDGKRGAPFLQITHGMFDLARSLPF